MITAIYRFERFDPATNTELWRRIPRWAWLYANASGGGQWLAADMLDWNQEVIDGR